MGDMWPGLAILLGLVILNSIARFLYYKKFGKWPPEDATISF